VGCEKARHALCILVVRTLLRSSRITRTRLHRRFPILCSVFACLIYTRDQHLEGRSTDVRVQHLEADPRMTRRLGIRCERLVVSPCQARRGHQDGCSGGRGVTSYRGQSTGSTACALRSRHSFTRDSSSKEDLHDYGIDDTSVILFHLKTC